MNKAFYIFIIGIFCSCLNEKSKQSENSTDTLSDQEKIIAQTFSDIESLLTIDNGEFWGKNLYGPLILINPETRLFYSNENNTTDSFKIVNSIYTDSLPADINIANTAIDWNNKRWSMVMLPLPLTKTARNNLIIHELYHRLQPEIGFENIQQLDNGHLDTYNGRLLLRLELQALEEALKSHERITKLNHVKNALAFRKKRHKTREITNAENSLELNEGLAEYTAIMLSGRGDNEMKKHLIQSKNNFYTNPTFVRSFAYQTIPIYGYLLSYIKPQWHKGIDGNTNLTERLIEAYQLNLNDDKSIAQIAELNTYEYQQIVSEETEREKKRIEKVARLKIKFVENQTLELPFQNMNISFDPRNITPLENFGTVYPNLRITDNWGILTVENGALLASNWSKVTVSKPIEFSDKVVIGDGWKLELNSEWNVEQFNNTFKIVKK